MQTQKVLTNIGVTVTTLQIMMGDFGRDASGRDVFYTVAAGNPGRLFIVDVNTETVLRQIELPDTSGAWAVTASDDGNVYIGAYNRGYLYKYSALTGILENLGHPVSSADPVLYPIVKGPVGKMYGGTYSSGAIYEYDPVAGSFTNFGRMADGQHYVRSTAYDEKHGKLYAGVGNQAHLIEYDLHTGTKRDLLPKEYRSIISVYDMEIVNGRLFCRKEIGDELFVLDAETGIQITVTDAATGRRMRDIPATCRRLSPKSPVDNRVYYTLDGRLWTYDLDTDTVEALPVMLHERGVAYAFLQLEDEGFPGFTLVMMIGNDGKIAKYNLETSRLRIEQMDFPQQAVKIHTIFNGPDGMIYTGGYLGGNIGRIDPSTLSVEPLQGIGQSEGIATLHGDLYFGIYPKARIYRYELTRPWNPADPDSPNPVELFTLEHDHYQDRPYAMLGIEEEGKLYIGTVPMNGKLGGAFTVYDPKTGERSVYPHIVPNQSILSLAYLNGMIYAGTTTAGGLNSPICETEAVLFQWDAKKGVKTFELVPVPMQDTISALLAGPDERIWGLNNGILFIFDPVTRSIVYSERKFPKGDTTWRDAFMSLGQDGHVYVTAAGRFARIDVGTMEVYVLVEQGAFLLAQDDAGNFYFKNEYELYQYSSSL